MNTPRIASGYTTRANYQAQYRESHREQIREKKRAWRKSRKQALKEAPPPHRWSKEPRRQANERSLS